MSEELKRQQFEQWYAAIFKAHSPENMVRNASGEYRSPQDQIVWMSWQEGRASRPEAESEMPAEQCGACYGSGWVVRDPDIGTDQECFSCDGKGEVADNAARDDFLLKFDFEHHRQAAVQKVMQAIHDSMTDMSYGPFSGTVIPYNRIHVLNAVYSLVGQCARQLSLLRRELQIPHAAIKASKKGHEL